VTYFGTVHKVNGKNCITCPFHAWSFDETGILVGRWNFPASIVILKTTACWYLMIQGEVVDIPYLDEKQKAKVLSHC
jgi:hypothetical protein